MSRDAISFKQQGRTAEPVQRPEPSPHRSPTTYAMSCVDSCLLTRNTLSSTTESVAFDDYPLVIGCSRPAAPDGSAVASARPVGTSHRGGHRRLRQPGQRRFLEPIGGLVRFSSAAS